MQQHEENMEQIFNDTQEKLAVNINEAEHRKKMPEQAVVVTITNSIVFWGDALERKRFKKKWIEQQTQTMSGSMSQELKMKGTVCSLKPIGHGKGEIWNIWDTADVHMTRKAQERLEKNASPEALKEFKETKKKADDYDNNNDLK